MHETWDETRDQARPRLYCEQGQSQAGLGLANSDIWARGCYGYSSTRVDETFRSTSRQVFRDKGTLGREQGNTHETGECSEARDQAWSLGTENMNCNENMSDVEDNEISQVEHGRAGQMKLTSENQRVTRRTSCKVRVLVDVVEVPKGRQRSAARFGKALQWKPLRRFREILLRGGLD